MVSTQEDHLDDCPHCMLPFEIETVSFRIFKPPRVLFICRACGLARAEGDERPVARRTKEAAKLTRPYFG
jgi:hypothetical protein